MRFLRPSSLALTAALCAPALLAAADPRRGPDELAASREIEQALEQAIRALPPAQREILMLRDVEGLTAPEVAEVTGLKIEAVKSRLHRARLFMRDQLQGARA